MEQLQEGQEPLRRVGHQWEEQEEHPRDWIRSQGHQRARVGVAEEDPMEMMLVVGVVQGKELQVERFGSR